MRGHVSMMKFPRYLQIFIRTDEGDTLLQSLSDPTTRYETETAQVLTAYFHSNQYTTGDGFQALYSTTKRLDGK